MVVMSRAWRIVRELTDRERAEVVGEIGVFDVGTVVYDFAGHTYGCVREPFIPVSMADGCGPFFAVPRSAVEEVVVPQPQSDPAELTQPVDVVAWLRALPVGAVLLSTREPERPRAWQVRPWHRYCGAHTRDEFTALVMAGSEEAYDVGDDEDAAMAAEEAPFRVLWTPEGGA